MASSTLLCPACGGKSITPKTKFTTTKGYAEVLFAPAAAFAAGRASVCLDCGHIALAMDRADLFRLREEIGKLTPIVEE